MIDIKAAIDRPIAGAKRRQSLGLHVAMSAIGAEPTKSGPQDVAEPQRSTSRPASREQGRSRMGSEMSAQLINE
jgi:hypothetical protein